MPLRTVEVPQVRGRVCYVTEERGAPHATVECAESRTAYRLAWDGPVEVGDWVEFGGEARVEVLRGGELRRIPYYHDPYDGSDRSGWRYLDVREPRSRARIGPLDAMDALGEARDALDAHLRRWYAEASPERLRRSLAALGAASDALRAELGRRTAAAMAAIPEVEV
jgi:hypothetical protein